jgi:hypothetical protein
LNGPVSRSPEEPTLPELSAMQIVPDVGTWAGRFKLTEVIARGGMGTVFRGVEPGSNACVAIKVLSMPPESRVEVLERFEREVRSLELIDSDHVVRIIDSGRLSGLDLPWLALEWIEGKRLGTHVRTVGPLSLKETWAIAEQLLKALSAVHDAGFVHRDVSANNVMLSERDGRLHVKLIDFGLVKPRPGHYSSVTRPGVIVGTPSVMAPEQFEPPKVDQRADIYAVGVLLSFMLSGNNPLQRVSIAEASVLMRKSVTRRPSEDVALHPAIDAVVSRCLEKSPDKRFPSAAHLAAELQRAVRTAQSSSLKTRARPTLAACLRSRQPGPEASRAFDKFVSLMTAEAVGWTARVDDAALALIDGGCDPARAHALLAQATAMMERLPVAAADLVLTLHHDTVLWRVDNARVMGGPVLEMMRWPLPDEGSVFASSAFSALLPLLEKNPHYGKLVRVV